MKYKDFEGSVEELVGNKLKEIEERENVRILHGVESGSRAWGFASPDSDYDVRFIYVRPVDYYLGLQEKKDFIDWELDETLDINGWDLTKALVHFHKSNAVVYEWSGSPVVYRTTQEWESIRAVAWQYFSCKSAMYHYYGTAAKNFSEYLQEDQVKYKKYFYVLRPLLACEWIKEKKCPPPVLFDALCESVLEENMRPLVDELLTLKKQMGEGERGKRLDELNEYIGRKLSYYKEAISRMPDDRKPDWGLLNDIFRRML